MSGLAYNQLSGNWLSDNIHFKLDRDFTVTEIKTGRKWTAPRGYKSDGTSTPGWAQPLIGGKFRPDFIEAAVIHDYYCETKERTQKDTHKIFALILKAEGVPWWKRTLMHQAVKVYNKFKNWGWK